MNIYYIHAASVILEPLQRNVSRMDIECPGDMVAYNCSVHSNSENVQLTWIATLPNQTTFNMTYYNAYHSSVSLGMGISTVLTEYVEDQYIESIILLTVLQNVSLNGTQLECRSAGLDIMTLIVLINISSKLSAIIK